MTKDSDNPSPVALEQRTLEADQRMYSPSVARNSQPLLEVLRDRLPAHGKVLEVGCGTGEHAVCFAKAMPTLSWLPTDPDAASRASTASWIREMGLSNVMAPRDLDASSVVWGVEELAPFDAVVSINMIHIAPWTAAVGLFSGAGKLLGDGGLLCLYGPFMHNGTHSALSNEAFDQSLKARNPSWGLRDIADLSRVAHDVGLNLEKMVEMPANNKLLVFRRTA